MCVYCMIGDDAFKWNPPWKPGDSPGYPPQVPQQIDPTGQMRPWSIEHLKEFRDLLARVKALEDLLGCPCEPNKADYLALFEKRIAHLEAAAKKKRRSRSLIGKRVRKAKRNRKD